MSLFQVPQFLSSAELNFSLLLFFSIILDFNYEIEILQKACSFFAPAPSSVPHIRSGSLFSFELLASMRGIFLLGYALVLVLYT